MKILIINSVCGIKSTGRICTDLACMLEKEGNEVKIAYGRDIVLSQFKKYAVKIGSNLDNNLHGLRARLFDGSGFGSNFATRRLIKWIKNYNPDIIHLHNLHGYYINIKVLFNYIRSCDKRIIWTLHDCWPFTGHSAYCDAVNCEKWETSCFNCPQKLLYPKSYIDRSKHNWKLKKDIFNGIKNLTIVTPSQWLSSLVKRSFLNKYPTVVISNGINTNIFYPQKNDLKANYGLKDKIVLLGVASIFDYLKGIDDFIELSRILDDNYRIVLVGKINNHKLLLPTNIIHIENTNSQEELAKLYNMADIFLNLTKQDTYPTVNLEAIACGLPLITYDVGGSTEIAKRYGGIVVKRGDFEQLLLAIRSIKRININSRLEIDLDESLCITKYLNLYRK